MATGMGRWACVLAVGALPLIGCGGGQATPTSCLQVQPCGGDVVGTWSFLGACSNIDAANELSECSVLSDVTEALAGLVTFNADGTYTVTNWRQTFESTESDPLACFGASTCTAGNGSTTDSSNAGTETVTTSCTGTSTCVCHVAGTRHITTASGIYGTASSVLTGSSGPLASSFPYCVEENRLHLMQTANVITTNPPSDQTFILSDIVAQRQ
jgi:hypothetical protein